MNLRSIVDEVDLRAAVADQTVEAVVQRVVLRVADRATDVEGAVGVAVIVDAGLEIAERSLRRHLAHRVDDAADVGAAVQHGGRTFQHLDALEPERLDAERSEGLRVELQTVEEVAGLLRGKAADEEEVVAGSKPKVEGSTPDTYSTAWPRFCALRSRICCAPTTDTACGVSISFAPVFVAV